MRMGAQTVLLALAVLTAQAAPAGAGSQKTQKITPRVARELLAPVCSSGAATGACTPCPAFTSFHDNTGEGLTPTAVSYGHFTGSRLTDALVDMDGCEPHVNNFGGSLLLRWQGLTSWKLLRYVQGIRTGQCLKVPAAGGRDLLLCQGNYGGMGTVVENLVLLDLAQPDVLTQNFFSTYDTAEACSPTGSIQHIVDWKLLPGRGGAAGSNVSGLEVSIKSATFTRAQGDTKAHDPCAGKLSAAPSRIYRLSYTFSGSRFALLPAARPAVAALTRDNPYFAGNAP
ncbi:hypothetical protein GCM10022631_41430 [Deinococcus rubellus]|uniref:Uncharacterized protein n=1 Tax=Deinococcus rubellus TaxID=1889240 RepID=A0ABY5YIW6_9DEIO|nr:hypothetical protein [Deinococcus rubellus]UWX65073.1 hypothetical protein N0D28_05295 [Deinococcus rubellus]